MKKVTQKGKVFVYEFEGGLYVNLTNACCNACEFCLRQNGDGVKETETLWLEKEPTFLEVVADIEKVDFKFNKVVFCGYGEPIYKLEILTKLCDYFKKNHPSIPIRLNTNGLGNAIFGRDITDELKGRVDVVSISLNAENAQNYDKVCHSKYGLNAYDHILSFAKLCVQKGIKTVLSVVDVIGEKAIMECQKIAQSLGAELRVRELITDNKKYE